MKQEEQNKSHHLRDKLDELESLPGEAGLDKKNSWEKLYAKMDKKKGRRISIPFWTIAASLFAIIATFYFITKEEHLKATDSRQVKQQQVKQSPAYKAPKQVESDLYTAELKKESKTSSATRRESVRPHSPTMKTIDVAETVQTATIIIPPQPAALLGTVLTDTMALLSAIPVKKKLRVVHVNDLGILFPASVAERQKKILPEAEPAHHVYPGLAFSRNASDDIIKIKLSPSN